MIAECTYLYPDGRHCRRLPRRGESLCRDHRRLVSAPRKTEADDEAFSRQMFAAVDEICALPLDQMLNHLSDCLNGLHLFVEAKASSIERARYHRAVIAAGAAMDCVTAQPRVFAESFRGITPHQAQTVMQILFHAAPRLPGEAAESREPAIP